MSNQLARIGMIIKIIGNSPGIKLTQLRSVLAETGFKVSEKTITEDIKLLKDELELLPRSPRLRHGYFLQGFHTVGGREVGVVIDALTAFGLSLSDARALEISRRLVSHTSTGNIRMFGLHQRTIYKAATSQKKIEDALFAATKEHLPVRLSIESPWKPEAKDITVYPLFKVFYERGWYLISRELNKKAYYPCRLDRIKKCEMPKRAEVNESHERDLDEAQYLINCGWGMDFAHTISELQATEQGPEVVVRFDQSVAPFLKEGVNRHPKAKLSAAPDGSGHLDFRIRLTYYRDFKKWVRSWGSKAWFIEPQDFVKEEVAQIRRQMFTYKMVTKDI